MTDEPLTTATAAEYADALEAGWAAHTYADDLGDEEFITAAQEAEFEAARDRYIAALNIVGRKSKLKLSYPVTPGPLGLSSVWRGK